MKITDFVSKENVAYFNRYRNGILYYIIHHNSIVNDVYEFPVYADDLAGATVNSHEKSITLMRYIRKALDDKTLVPYN